MKNANATILAAVIIAAGSTLAAQQLQHKQLQYARTLLGAAGLGFGLSVVATASPDVADGLAWLIIITSLLVNGQPIFDRISLATSKTGHTKPATHITPTTVEA
jgi:hypothetical protein